jgi:hypothetical protein
VCGCQVKGEEQEHLQTPQHSTKAQPAAQNLDTVEMMMVSPCCILCWWSLVVAGTIINLQRGVVSGAGNCCYISRHYQAQAAWQLNEATPLQSRGHPQSCSCAEHWCAVTALARCNSTGMYLHCCQHHCAAVDTQPVLQRVEDVIHLQSGQHSTAWRGVAGTAQSHLCCSQSCPM